MGTYAVHKILIIEDNIPLAESMRSVLELFSNYAYDIYIANSLNKGIEIVRNWQPELVTLDLVLPDLHGFVALDKFNSNGFQPKVLVVSGLSQKDDILMSLERGADDYLVKPFLQKELYLRVNNLLKRGKIIEDKKLLFDDIFLDTFSKTITRHGKVLTLTQKEYSLILYLMQNAGSVIGRNELLSVVWKDKDCFPNLVDVYMEKLRKIIDKPYGSNYLKTAYGHGYYFDPGGAVKN